MKDPGSHVINSHRFYTVNREFWSLSPKFFISLITFKLHMAEVQPFVWYFFPIMYVALHDYSEIHKEIKPGQHSRCVKFFETNGLITAGAFQKKSTEFLFNVFFVIFFRISSFSN